MEVDQKCYPFAASSINFSMMALNALRSGVSMRTPKKDRYRHTLVLPFLWLSPSLLLLLWLWPWVTTRERCLGSTAWTHPHCAAQFLRAEITRRLQQGVGANNAHSSATMLAVADLQAAMMHRLFRMW